MNEPTATPAPGRHDPLDERLGQSSGASKRALKYKAAATSLASAIPFLAFVGALIAAELIDQRNTGLFLGPLMIRETHLVAPPLPPPVAIRSQLSVFFENGSAGVSGADRIRLRRFAVALLSCDPGAITVVGSASSAKYRDDAENDDQGNRLLAEARAREVAAVLKAANNTLDLKLEILDRRAYADTRGSPEVEHPAEYLNRRADVSLQYDGCRPRESDR